mmetsp:Transcript_3861/g.15321  ORF Transcript_3861/g.15321 Transcript_3861/m.15321 type:complete len:427 (-) Transcript_3861:350-1630(-)
MHHSTRGVSGDSAAASDPWVVLPPGAIGTICRPDAPHTIDHSSLYQGGGMHWLRQCRRQAPLPEKAAEDEEGQARSSRHQQWGQLRARDTREPPQEEEASTCASCSSLASCAAAGGASRTSRRRYFVEPHMGQPRVTRACVERAQTTRLTRDGPLVVPSASSAASSSSSDDDIDDMTGVALWSSSPRWRTPTPRRSLAYDTTGSPERCLSPRSSRRPPAKLPPRWTLSVTSALSKCSARSRSEASYSTEKARWWSSGSRKPRNRRASGLTTSRTNGLVKCSVAEGISSRSTPFEFIELGRERSATASLNARSRASNTSQNASAKMGTAYTRPGRNSTAPSPAQSPSRSARTSRGSRPLQSHCSSSEVSGDDEEGPDVSWSTAGGHASSGCAAALRSFRLRWVASRAERRSNSAWIVEAIILDVASE